MGGVVTTMCVEEHPELFDGGVALGSYSSEKIVDAFLGLQLAADILFAESGGFPAEWGNVGDMRDDIDFMEVAPENWGIGGTAASAVRADEVAQRAAVGN